MDNTSLLIEYERHSRKLKTINCSLNNIMDLIPYSDSDSDNDDDEADQQQQPQQTSNDQESDDDEIIEVTKTPITNHHNFNFGTKTTDKSKNNNVSLDFGSDSKHQSLFDVLPMPSIPSSSSTSLHQKRGKKRKKKKKKKSKKDKKSKQESVSEPKRVSLMDILPERKISPPSPPPPAHTAPSEPAVLPTDDGNGDEIKTYDIRRRQAEAHRVHTNPLATFSISASNDDDEDNDGDIDGNPHHEQLNMNIGHKEPEHHGVALQTASSMYKVDDSNLYIARPGLPEVPPIDDGHPVPEPLMASTSRSKPKSFDSEDIITVSQSEHLLKKEKEWRRTFEIDDITKEEIKVVPTNTYNRETGKVEGVTKYTKTQKKKHQINTLAYEAQEKAP